MREPRARRSELATPASSEKMCERSASSGADLVFLDLEDACAPIAKEGARATAVAALTELDWGRTLRAVRVNGLDTIWCHDDIIEVVTGAGDALDVLIVPKARSARDVWWVDVLLTQLEAKLGLRRRIGLEVLIEEAEGLANAVEIAKASDRLEAIIFGAGDLSASQRARVDGNFDPVERVPRRLLALRPRPGRHRGPSGRASTPSTRPTPPTRTPTATAAVGGPRQPPRASTASGPSTPSQIPIANEVFSPTDAGGRQTPRQAIEDLPPRRRPRAWAPSDATAGWSTPPTCGWPRTCSTRPPRWPSHDRSRAWSQWATGNIGSRSLRGVLEHPELELVGVHVHSPDKVGQDAGALVDRPAVGVAATGTIEEVLALATRLRPLHATALRPRRGLPAAPGGREHRDHPR